MISSKSMLMGSGVYTLDHRIHVTKYANISYSMMNNEAHSEIWSLNLDRGFRCIM